MAVRAGIVRSCLGPAFVELHALWDPEVPPRGYAPLAPDLKVGLPLLVRGYSGCAL